MDLKDKQSLADAIDRLAQAVKAQNQLFEILLEAIPATKEAELLGVSEKTVRRHREARRLQRMLPAS